MNYTAIKCGAMLLLGLVISSMIGNQVHAGDTPNFLIIMSDQHAPQFSGPYGHPLAKTPALDRLATEGVVFENAYTTSPICVPSRMSFMTGKYVHRIGIWDNGVPLAEDEPTWAQYLRNLGYNVALSGKMHFRGFDQLHGFEEQLGVDMNSMNYPMPPDWTDKSLTERTRSRTEAGGGPGINSVIESDAYCTEKAIEYMKDPVRQERPWALCVGLVSPHPPFKVPRKYYDIYPEEDIDLPEIPKGHIAEMHPSNRRMRHRMGFINEDLLPEEEIRKVRATYYGMVSFMDDLIGDMVEVLRKTGQLDNTVVVYVSDHGEMMGEHGMWSKLNFYEHSVRIPMIISYPKSLLRDHRVPWSVSTVDLTATIMSLAGVDMTRLSSPIDGRDMTILLMNPNAPWVDEVFSECYADYNTGPKAMYRRGKYKLVYYHNETPELFDLEQDPGEFHDLSESEKHVEVLNALKGDLLAFWHPENLEEVIIESQQKRLMMRPYLFPYIEKERERWPEKFTKDLNSKPK